MSNPPDVVVHDHGSICLVEPLTDEARLWLNDHLHPGAAWWGPSVVVEPRYVMPLLQGMDRAGLKTPLPPEEDLGLQEAER